MLALGAAGMIVVGSKQQFHHPSSMNVAVIGQGYVGLPLSIQFARSGATVIGLDVDAQKVEALNQGRSYIKHIEPATILEQVKSGRFSA